MPYNPSKEDLEIMLPEPGYEKSARDERLRVVALNAEEVLNRTNWLAKEAIVSNVKLITKRLSGYYYNQGLNGDDYGTWEVYREAYDTECNRLKTTFKQDALQATGLLNHPKMDKIWSMAVEWEYDEDEPDFELIWERLITIIDLLV